MRYAGHARNSSLGDPDGLDVIPARLIEKKRDGQELRPHELEAFLGAYLAGDVPEYQMSAFLMAVVFTGLSAAELDCMVDVMLRSGDVLRLDHLPGPRVDKHSTGGVGDKVSLVLAPLAAELGLYVPMMSGRGLGHSGGTLDKLESIPGFRTDVSLTEFLGVLESVGCAMIGQTAEIAPLDKRLYGLRDATATVPAIPLISASIMSKKLAEGLNGLVLDVKVGSGAFLADLDDALELARTMVRIGEARGVETTALLTRMDRPLGRAVGNALEVREAIDCLRGGGPEDLRRIVIALTGEMLVLGQLAADPSEAERLVVAALDSGGALERLKKLVEAQGGDASVIDDPSGLPSAAHRVEVRSPSRGIIQEVAPRPLGYGLIELGGGRRKLDDDVDPSVGFVVSARPGDRVDEGDVLGEVHAADRASLELGVRTLLEAVRIAADPEETPLPLVSHRVSRSGVEVLVS